jgi:predicted aspartyl protease
MLEFPYDAEQDPSMPVCQATFSVEATGRRLALTAVLDTGADATLIPLAHLQALGARRVFETGLRSQWGERRLVFLYLVDIQIGDVTLPGVHAVGDDLGQEVVLGRDVLNRLRVLLDGPARVSRFLDGNAPRRAHR